MFMRKLMRPLSAACLLFCALTVISAYAGPKWLITPEEAAKVRSLTGDFKEPAAAVEGPGPLILVRNPKALQSVRSPVNIFVVFKPGKSGQPPDMSTLSVTLIGFFNINITDRVREYVKTSSLEIEEADLPSGSHQLRIAIKDISGNPNERDAVVSVAEE
jgi:hypothetical protein